MSKIMVREALVASVACTWPPVRRHSRKQSMVPKASLPASARARAPVDQEPGLGLDRGLQAVGLEPVAERRRAPVLPDDGVVDRRAGLAVPDQRGFALVGDADPGQLTGLEPGLGERALDHRQGAAPDVLGVVLDPARLRVVLGELLLCLAERPAAPVEQHGAAAGGALVDGQDGPGAAHVRCLSRFVFVVAMESWCGRRRQRSRRARAVARRMPLMLICVMEFPGRKA
jgi:hypothetical protein